MSRRIHELSRTNVPAVQPFVEQVSLPSGRTPGVAHAASALATALLLTVLAGPSFAQAGAPTLGCPALLDHRFQRLQGGQVESLCDYRGKVVLVVNTASYCGYTHQYEGLEALYRKYKDRGLVVVGFPSNDFGGQEPGTNQEIADFCRTTYGVQFPMYEKTSVSGVADNPLYTELAARTGERPRWNFHKYLIDRRGVKVTSFRSAVEPDSREFVRAIEQMLAEPATAGRG
jgi:glutathione peroxidase